MCFFEFSLQIFHIPTQPVSGVRSAPLQGNVSLSAFVVVISWNLMAVTENPGLISQFVNICRTPNVWAKPWFPVGFRLLLLPMPWRRLFSKWRVQWLGTLLKAVGLHVAEVGRLAFPWLHLKPSSTNQAIIIHYLLLAMINWYPNGCWCNTHWKTECTPLKFIPTVYEVPKDPG